MFEKKTSIKNYPTTITGSGVVSLSQFNDRLRTIRTICVWHHFLNCQFSLQASHFIQVLQFQHPDDRQVHHLQEGRLNSQFTVGGAITANLQARYHFRFPTCHTKGQRMRGIFRANNNNISNSVYVSSISFSSRTTIRLYLSIQSPSK